MFDLFRQGKSEVANCVPVLIILCYLFSVRLTVIMDYCHSGTGLDLPFEWAGSQHSSGPGGWTEADNPFYSEGDVVLLSSCTDSLQGDIEGRYESKTGALTSSLCSILRATPAPSYTDLMRTLHRMVTDKRTDIRPQLSASQRFDCTLPFFLDDFHMNANRRKGRAQKGAAAAQPRPLPYDPKLQQMVGRKGKALLMSEIELE